MKHRLGAWFGSGPRRHGEPLAGRSVSYLELFYDLVFVVLVGQAAHTLAAHPGWGGTAEFVAVFGLVWIAWINGTLYHELHGREDGGSRFYVFAQMGVLAVLAVFTAYAGTTDGTAFALSYSVLLLLLFWQWYEVRRHDLPEDRHASTPYLLGLTVTIVVMVASAWLADGRRARRVDRGHRRLGRARPHRVRRAVAPADVLPADRVAGRAHGAVRDHRARRDRRRCRERHQRGRP